MKSKTFSDRIRRVYASSDVDALIIEKPIDLFYLTGLNLSLGTLVITSKGGHLFVDGRYIEFAKKHAPCSVELTTKDAVTKKLKSYKTIGFDSQETTYSRFEELKKLATGPLKPISQPTTSTRLIKSREELILLKKSAKLLWKGFQYIRKKLKVGMTEEEAAKLFEIFCLENGASAMAFEPIFAFGKNSAYPHYRPGNVRLKKDDNVLIDIGVLVDHYNSDMTRTFFFGKPDPRLVPIHATVKAAHDAALKICKPGVKLGELDKIATQVIHKAGFERYMAHSLGHGVGLEIHEFPRLKYKGIDSDVHLEEGMVITIEPGLYWEGVGGCRYEDTIAVTKGGYENWYP